MNDRQYRKHDSCIPEVNTIFNGEIVSIKDYGAFVKIPGCYKNGLIHISQISQSKVDNVSDVINVKDHVWCKVISLGEDGDKISLSMKVVNQGSGKDLDPNGVQIGLEEKRRKTYTPFSQQKITLDAVYNTVCKQCGTKGHLAQDCFQRPGEKSYELLTEEKEEPIPNTVAETSAVRAKEHKSKKSKKRKHDKASSPSSSSSPDDHQKHRVKKKKRKRSHSHKRKH